MSTALPFFSQQIQLVHRGRLESLLKIPLNQNALSSAAALFSTNMQVNDVGAGCSVPGSVGMFVCTRMCVSLMHPCSADGSKLIWAREPLGERFFSFKKEDILAPPFA